MRKLLIVESPTKAKTISKYLGKDYEVLSSFGHVRDLPKSKIGIDLEHDFTPHYVIPTKAKKTVTALKKAAAKADEVYLATDEDREGEAISWHLAEILGLDEAKAKRITFHEITKAAIEQAVEHPRHLDMKMVDAQQARRILDRLVGYSLSPLLWKKVQRGLSAGRVQSVAVRLIVERERERDAFKQEEYWSIDGEFTKDGAQFAGALIRHAGKKVEKMEIKTEADAKAIVDAVSGKTFVVGEIIKKKVKKTPPTPLTTSSLQIEANTKLGMSAKMTMQVAQRLYETGRITYMRTDSFNLAEAFLTAAHDYIGKEYGAEYRLAEPRLFKTKSKGAQEAHEAIRPTDAGAHPAQLKDDLQGAEWRLYNLIWRRTMATQMPEAEVERTAIDLICQGTETAFRANGSILIFDGFMKVYKASKETLLPSMTTGDAVSAVSVTPTQHFTEPPARYSDATLVKVLEEHGIGRPSTYAPTIATIVNRGYVERDESKKLFPTPVALQVTDILIEHFPNVVDYAFTAKMENSLDEIAEGTVEWVPMLTAFWGPFAANLKTKEAEIVKTKREEIPTEEICEKCGKPMVIKFGRFGKFLACTGFPECRNTKPLKQDSDTMEVISTEEKCAACGADMVVKQGRFGSFLSCSRYPECKTIKSLAKGTGVTCPQCNEGEIGERRSKRGKTFYSCNRYPDCKFALWSKPTGEKCPTCQSLLVLGPKGSIKCSNKECDYKTEAE
ncbi:MAG: type I DNA topoisomerase [Patescibacteria group bacterium]